MTNIDDTRNTPQGEGHTPGPWVVETYRRAACSDDMLGALRLALPFVRNDNAAKVIRAAIAKATGGAA